MPQLYSTSLSRNDVMQEAYSAMSLCSFNINTFLLVLNVSPLTDEDKGELEVISDIFDTPDKKFWDSLMVLFIYQGNRQDKAVTEFIHRNRDIKELLRKCGHKYHILSTDQRPNHEQLSELLQMIKMVPCYSYDTCLKAQLEKRIQLEARNKEMEKENRALIEINSKAETERTNCVRILLVGRTGNGKSATGNTILNRKAFKSQACFKSVTSTCQGEHGFVEGKPVVVVDTPGLFDTQLSQEEVKAEILKCISLLSPGPHVFLLVLRVGRFTTEEKETLNLIKETFGKNAQIFTIIIFTHGDLLDDQTIESCLEDSDPQMKKLIRDCGQRYHVIDNTKQDHSKQVIDLLEKINRMVEKNGGGCYTNEMFEEAEAAIKLEMEKILKSKKEEMEREKRLRDKHEAEMAEMERRIAEQKNLIEKERKEKEEELKMKEQLLRNELKRRERQEEKERKKREQDEEQRRIEEKKREQWAKEWQKIEKKQMRLEEEQQKRDQEYRERYERERREMEKLHKERLKRKHEEEYQKKLKQEMSEWELKEKKMTEEFEQEKRKREDREKERIEKRKKERERIEKEYENCKIEMKRQQEKWEKSWLEKLNKREKEERKGSEAEREKQMKLKESFERERKEEEEKRKIEDKARREQEERERREMEEEYKRKLNKMKRKYEKERQDIKEECAHSAMSELSKHEKNKVLSDEMKELKERHQTKPDTQREVYK